MTGPWITPEPSAAGQVARVSGGGTNFLKVDLVWDVPTNIIPSIYASSAYRGFTIEGLKPQSHWYRFPQAGDRFVLVAGSRFWPTKHSDPAWRMPAFVTVEEVLADRVLRKLNTGYVEDRMQLVKDLLDTSGCGPFNYIPVPVIYFGDGRPLGNPDTPVEYRRDYDEDTGALTHVHSLDKAHTIRAMTPNLANYQFVGGTFYFPRQFGPRNSQGSDLFESRVRSRIADALFTDVWDTFHVRAGEVHCASTVVSKPFDFDWWSVHP